MDDLFALIEDYPQDDDGHNGALLDDVPNPKQSSSLSESVSESPKHKHSHHSSTHSNDSTIDPLTKIRIVNRQTSKVDLIDIFAPFSFHTTAVLASMSKKDLSSILLPSKNYDNSLSGRTNAATMGIIFKNSGTIISKKTGRAFTILKVGDLHTGPTISVMLFGDAYRQYTTKVRSGQVVAFVGMSLLPLKENQGNDTRITFSINDCDQIISVGIARDFGVCAGHTHSYSHAYGHGHGPNQEKKRCTNHVDLRISRYCQYHIKQQMQQHKQQQTSRQHSIKHGTSSTSVSSAKRKKGNISLIEAMKLERAESQMLKRQAAINMYNNSINTSSNGTSMVHKQNCCLDVQHQNAVTNSTKDKFLRNVPKHMSKGSPLGNHHSTSVGSGAVHNPYAKNNNKLMERRTALSTATLMKDKKRKNKQRLQDGSNDLLNQALSVQKEKNTRSISSNIHGRKELMGKATSNKSSHKKKRKFVQSFVEGFDGQVFVPKPNPLFSKKSPMALSLELSSLSATTTTTCNYSAIPNSSPKSISSTQRIMLMERQKRIAERIRSNKSKETDSLNTTTTNNNNNAISTSNPNELNDFLASSSFAQMNRFDKTKVFESKSKYETEANAESYARNRNILTQLEKKELSTEKRNGKKKGGNAVSSTTSGIVMQWFCATCSRTTGIKPSICLRQNHVVKRRRQIKKKESVIEKRMGMNAKADKSIGGGGMVLASGLEWSSWNNN